MHLSPRNRFCRSSKDWKLISFSLWLRSSPSQKKSDAKKKGLSVGEKIISSVKKPFWRSRRQTLRSFSARSGFILFDLTIVNVRGTRLVGFIVGKPRLQPIAAQEILFKLFKFLLPDWFYGFLFGTCLLVPKITYLVFARAAWRKITAVIVSKIGNNRKEVTFLKKLCREIVEVLWNEIEISVSLEE